MWNRQVGSNTSHGYTNTHVHEHCIPTHAQFIHVQTLIKHMCTYTRTGTHMLHPNTHIPSPLPYRFVYGNPKGSNRKRGAPVGGHSRQEIHQLRRGETRKRVIGPYTYDFSRGNVSNTKDGYYVALWICTEAGKPAGHELYSPADFPTKFGYSANGICIPIF